MSLGNVNVMSVVIAAAPSLLILCSVEAILMAQCLSVVRPAKCEITVPVCTRVLTPERLELGVTVLTC